MSVQRHHFRPFDSAESERSTPGVNDVAYVLASDYDALTARVAELEKDAARYRWLRDQSDYGHEAICRPQNGTPAYIPKGGALDFVIDAAMAAPADGEKQA
jgi:hypothetical protein